MVVKVLVLWPSCPSLGMTEQCPLPPVNRTFWLAEDPEANVQLDQSLSKLLYDVDVANGDW